VSVELASVEMEFELESRHWNGRAVSGETSPKAGPIEEGTAATTWRHFVQSVRQTEWRRRRRRKKLES
jgi:hypothetical protein